MIYVVIPAKWLLAKEDNCGPRQLECSYEEVIEWNSKGYHVYYYPNHPKVINVEEFVEAKDVDVFEWVFIDYDHKHKTYESKEAFVAKLLTASLLPTKIIDSGGGIHAYWRVTDLDQMSYLRLSRRMARHYNTDLATTMLKQLMRVPNTANVKDPENPLLCRTIYEHTDEYTSEQLDKFLPPITVEDEDFCVDHYNKAYKVVEECDLTDTIPNKFKELVRTNKEVKEIWSGGIDDRSKGDYRLAHIMFAHNFSKQEAFIVLTNGAKALTRAAKHRISYANNIIDKIWTYETKGDEDGWLSKSVKDILAQGEDKIKGTRFPCHKLFDDTEYGFRLGHVMGLVAGSGVGKTAVALNMFKWFTQNNPNYTHFFVSLEQPANEIADRWRTLCGEDTRLHDKVHVLSNYTDDGSFRHLSLDAIKDYILKFQQVTGKQVGTVVIDHIGALKKQNKNGENQALIDIMHQMKSVAVETNTFIIMQSQAPREKAGIGDLELSKDCAYGSVFFEAYCDYLVCLWQPLKRVYTNGAPTIMAFKFGKIRHKKQGADIIQEDVRYQLFFDPNNETLRELTEDEEKGIPFWLSQAANQRKLDRKTDVVPYVSRKEKQ